jgi:hypothetical protein
MGATMATAVVGSIVGLFLNTEGYLIAAAAKALAVVTFGERLKVQLRKREGKMQHLRANWTFRHIDRIIQN